MSDLWVGVSVGALLSIPIGLGCGVVVVLYTKDLLDWKEGRAALRSIKEAARVADFESRVISYVLDEQSLTRFAMYTVVRLLVSVGCITSSLLLVCISMLGALLIHTLGVAVASLQSVFQVALFVPGALSGFLLGVGSSALLSVIRDAKGLFRALKTVNEKLTAAISALETPDASGAESADLPDA